MVKPSKSSSKSKKTGKKKELPPLRIDDPAVVEGVGDTPTSASELKSLLQRSLEREHETGIANTTPSAQSESPLLVRTDTATPDASPKAKSRKGGKRTTNRRKDVKKKKKSTAGAHEAALPPQASERWSTPRIPSDEPHPDGDSSEPQQPHRHLQSAVGSSGPRPNVSFGGFGFGCLRRSTGVPWAADRLICSMGTLRTTSGTSNPGSATASTLTLSQQAQAQLESVEPMAKTCWIELYIGKCDELPFGVYFKPQVQVHLVDRFTGRAIHPTQTTSPAKLNYSSTYGNAFQWHQSLRFPIAFAEFVSPRALLLFEIFELQTSTRKKKTRQHRGNQFEEVSQFDTTAELHHTSNSLQHERSDPSSLQHGKRRRIAWGFYSPVSEKGNIVLRSLSPLDGLDEDSQKNQDNLHQECASNRGEASDRTLRLQLYDYQLLTWMDQYQAKTQWQWTQSCNADSQMPAVYLQYQKRRRAPIASTIYVEIHPIVPPISGTATTAAVAPVPEPIRGDESEHPLTATESGGESAKPPPHEQVPGNNNAQDVRDEAPQMSASDPLIVCKRDTTEACLVPHRVLCRLPTGKKGCSCVAFSPCGLYLAAAINPGSGEFLIHIYAVNLSHLVQISRGHCGMVYALEWGTNSQRLISSSSDGTTRLWELHATRRGSKSGINCTSSALWQHSPSPCFVYCGIFHPSREDLVLTGASDGQLRVWSTLASKSNVAIHVVQVSFAALHSIRIEPKSLRLFCGDAQGNITIWKHLATSASPNPLSYELIKTIHTGQSAVTSLQLHPRKQHLLVHTQPNLLLKYELRSYLLLNNSYSGVVCETLMGKSRFSPDGRFVASGSENGVPLLFSSIHGGQKFQRGVWGSPFFHQHPVMDIAWCPSAHIVALCSYAHQVDTTVF
uniref:Uncharacterized protein n=1 Tax=Globisporangium ultimum (strain ATCC 200006 / CBS 805.95 / DAOM BR144) TaxID=431595 RepID=K3XA19_GLOUD